jgi:hypothetical protein
MAIVFSQLDDQGPTKGFYAIHHPFKKDIWFKKKLRYCSS